MSELLASPLFWAGVKIAVAIGLVLQIVPVMVWVERKVCAYAQDRVGPNRAALFGTFRLGGMVHSLTDAIKMLFKEDVRPASANGFFFVIAPFLVLTPALMALAVIPWADDLSIAPGGALPAGAFPLQIARLDVGLLFVFAISGLSVIGIMLAGWSSNNKFSLLGGLRSAAQLVSYEIALTLSAVSMMVLYGTVRPEEIVLHQGGAIWHWGIFYQPLAFVIFLIAIFAESNRLPFDLPEGESELVAGYHTEYSGFKFGLFMMAEYSHMIVASAIISTVFLGGWQIPWASTISLQNAAPLVARVLVGAHGAIFLLVAAALANRYLNGPRRWKNRGDLEPGIFAVVLGLAGLGALAFALLWHPALDGRSMLAQGIAATAQFMFFMAKIGFFLFLFVWVRWTLPRFRFDQVMRLGWKMLMPLALLNIVATGLGVLWFGSRT